MVYISSSGEVTDNKSYYHQAKDFLMSFYNFICFFFMTLYDPYVTGDGSGSTYQSDSQSTGTRARRRPRGGIFHGNGSSAPPCATSGG
ncbi:hypothetical protein SNEBB_007754 [Seison nebaliae]|nr:hypothetical protein SNEBB_007754 [Seison nebaliae]